MDKRWQQRADAILRQRLETAVFRRLGRNAIAEVLHKIHAGRSGGLRYAPDDVWIVIAQASPTMDEVLARVVATAWLRNGLLQLVNYTSHRMAIRGSRLVTDRWNGKRSP
jgi:hypothetical protein